MVNRYSFDHCEVIIELATDIYVATFLHRTGGMKISVVLDKEKRFTILESNLEEFKNAEEKTKYLEEIIKDYLEVWKFLYS